MARTASPLRYPGGKSSLLRLVSEILRINEIDRGHYAEPFAGGGGLALSLLYKGDVGQIHLNDIDPAISALWRSILNKTDDIVRLMHQTPITIAEWGRQREIYLSQQDDDVVLGFATLFLNRVNRSGIIRTGGVIGGLAQVGRYQMDCRFNKPDIETRIRRIARYRSRIRFTSNDAGDFLAKLVDELPTRSLIFADPPYFVQGAELYTNSFRQEDHEAFRNRLIALERPWILTYDNAPEVRKLYRFHRQFRVDLYYSAQTKRTGSELLMASEGLRLPNDLQERQVQEPQYSTATA